MWERYRHTVENTPRQVGRANRNVIFWWHLWMGRSVHVECATANGRYAVIHSQACICTIRGIKHTSIPCDGTVRTVLAAWNYPNMGL